MLHIQRSHNQTMVLLQEGSDPKYMIVDVCHVRDHVKLHKWRSSGAKFPEVQKISFASRKRT